MRVIPLQSGSNGNCVFVESGDTRLLIDAGISGIQAQERLASVGVAATTIHALLISHDHSDHVQCAGVFHRKFGLPVHVTERTLLAARRRRKLGQIDDVRCFQSGKPLRIGQLVVETIPTPHDGVDGVAFVIDDGRHRVGVLTDLGHVFSALQDVLPSLDGVVLESNYDPQMLETGPYPEPLKQRIRGPGGHLSNVESAELLAGVWGKRLKWACLAHLSEHNNDPKVAMSTHRHVLGSVATVRVASRYGVSSALHL